MTSIKMFYLWKIAIYGVTKLSNEKQHFKEQSVYKPVH